MAGAHFTAMRLLERSASEQLPPGEAVRFTNAAARMMDVYQSGCLTLQKLKSRASSGCWCSTSRSTSRTAVRRWLPVVWAGGRASRGRGGKDAR